MKNKQIKENNEFPVTGWKSIFYLIGWFSILSPLFLIIAPNYNIINLSVLSLLFWIIIAITHHRYNRGEPFFNNAFHLRVFKWGIFIVIWTVLMIILFAVFTARMSKFAINVQDCESNGGKCSADDCVEIGQHILPLNCASPAYYCCTQVS